MDYTGNLLKMRSSGIDPVNYTLVLDQQEILMNNLLGKELSISYQGMINCIKCGRVTKKSYGQGYCYPCFINSPETEECVLRPELCRAHEGISRDMDYAKKHCLIDHYVYLTLTSNLKVGVTRHHQIPTRWIDQGAWKAVKLAMTPNRYLAGKIEVELKNFMKDKTNWRNMLTNKTDTGINLIREKDQAIDNLPPELQEYAIDDDTITEIKYPVLQYPQKVTSITLDKIPCIKETLIGIKGQYLIFKSNKVLNIRKHNGYLVSLSF